MAAASLLQLLVSGYFWHSADTLLRRSRSRSTLFRFTRMTESFWLHIYAALYYKSMIGYTYEKRRFRGVMSR